MKVRVLPYQPHCFAYGGFEVQMLHALLAARSAGVDIQPLDVWSRDASFDILHVWGLSEIHLKAVTWAKRSGKKVVISTLLPYSNPRVRMRFLINNFLGRDRSLKLIASLLDSLVVVNESQAEVAKTLYGIPQNKISKIPNIVQDNFYLPTSDDNSIKFRVREYLICVGGVSVRKNQLKLAKAAISAEVPLLLVGQTVAGEETYAEMLRKLVVQNDFIQWLEGGLPVGSAELVAAYQGCIGFALPSYNETQPISALEAAALGKPLLLSDMDWAKQDLYAGAYLVDPGSEKSILKGIRRMRDEISNTNRLEALTQCRSLNVGRAYANIYEQVLGKKINIEAGF